MIKKLINLIGIRSHIGIGSDLCNNWSDECCDVDEEW